MTMTRSQERIAKQLIAAFSNATACHCNTLSDNAVTVKLELISSDCKTRRVNLFRVGTRGGLRTLKQEFKANDF